MRKAALLALAFLALVGCITAPPKYTAVCNYPGCERTNQITGKLYATAEPQPDGVILYHRYLEFKCKCCKHTFSKRLPDVTVKDWPVDPYK